MPLAQATAGCSPDQHHQTHAPLTFAPSQALGSVFLPTPDHALIRGVGDGKLAFQLLKTDVSSQKRKQSGHDF